MTDSDKLPKTEKEITTLIFSLFTKAIIEHEAKNPGISFKDQEVLNATVSLMYHIISTSEKGDVKGIERALNKMVKTVMVHARRASLAVTKTPKIVV